MSRLGDKATEGYFDRLASAGRQRWQGNVDKWAVIVPLLEGLPPGGRVLECGGGTGMYTVQMLRAGFRVTVVDLSTEALDVNRQVAAESGLADALTIVQGRFQDVAGRLDGPFQAAAFFKTLHHFPDLRSIEQALAAGYDAVGHGGMLIGLEPNGECPFWRPGLIARGTHRRAGQPLWLMERNLMLTTERNLARMFSRLEGASWEVRWEYLIPASVARRLPGVCTKLNRLLARTPLRRRAFNLTFRVRKHPR